MNLAVALSAARHGATVVNHVKVLNLHKGLDKVHNYHVTFILTTQNNKL